jgi:hypothetical protein
VAVGVDGAQRDVADVVGELLGVRGELVVDGSSLERWSTATLDA